MGLALSGQASLWMAGPHFKRVHNKRDSCKKHFGPKKTSKMVLSRRYPPAGPGRFGVRFFRHNFGNRRAWRAGITMNKLRGSSRNPVAPHPDFSSTLFCQFFFHSAQTQPCPTPTPIAFRRVSEYIYALSGPRFFWGGYKCHSICENEQKYDSFLHARRATAAGRGERLDLS